MICHSSANQLDGACLVQLEGIEPGTPEVTITLVAKGVAAKHNSGYAVTGATVAQWLDDDGRPIADGFDTTYAAGARVLCRVEKP